MALSHKDKETDRLAGAVAALIGETLTDEIRHAFAGRLERERLRRGQPADLAGHIHDIATACARLPDVDPCSPDDIVGYDDNGMWR